MQRAERLLDMIQGLRRRRRPVTAETLASELDVSVRTVYRDIAALMRQGVPVRGEAGIGYVLDAGFDLPPLMLSPDEIEAVLVGMRWLSERADPVLARAAEDVVSKVAAVLPAHLRPILLDGALFAPAYGARHGRRPGRCRGHPRRDPPGPQARDRLSRRERPGDAADDLADRHDLLRACPHRHRLVRIARGFPPFPHRPRHRARPCARSAIRPAAPTSSAAGRGRRPRRNARGRAASGPRSGRRAPPERQRQRRAITPSTSATRPEATSASASG